MQWALCHSILDAVVERRVPQYIRQGRLLRVPHQTEVYKYRA